MKKEVIATADLMSLVESAISNNQKATFKVTGSSMTPFFTHALTSVTIVKVEKPLKKYDVVLFKYQNSFKLHRIISINGERVVASGDALLSKEMIQVEDIIGIVESFETEGQNTMSFDQKYLSKVKRYYFFKPLLIRLRRFK
ncbi:MAG: S24/S26 family peptidase [Acholeplasmataceae bacterium]|nr:S24/S26 family peptidase [Acholeplasmataceae bacterium]